MRKILSILMVALILLSTILMFTPQVKAQASVKGDLEGPDYLQPPKHYKTRQMMLAEAGYLADPGPPPVPVSGTRELLVVLVEFSDVAPDPTHTTAYFQDRFFDTSPPSVRDYYDEVSYGTFTYIPGAVVGWHLSTHPQSDWLDPHDPRPIVVEAIQHADQTFNFAPYDTNGDGVVTNDELTIFIIVTGDLGGAFHWATTSPVPSNDGVNVEGEFSATHENRHIGSYCHELGHDLGLPDLYDTTPMPTPDSEGIGDYGLMGGGSWTFSQMDAWCKIQLGWITPIVVTQSGYYDVHDAETHAEAFVLIDPTHSSNEYFLVENRRPANSYYETIGPPVAPGGTYPDQGVVIYHIDETRVQDWINHGTNNVNADEAHKGVDVECADHQTSHVVDADDLDLGINRGDVSDLWDASAYDFSDTSTPCNASWYINERSGMGVGKFPAASATMKVYFTIPGKFAYVYCTWGGYTMQDEINNLHASSPSKYSFDWYDENNVGDLWANLGEYKAIVIDEDTFYSDSSWSQYGGSIYGSFRSHASDLETFVKNGGGIFTSGENDLQRTQAWDWLPPGMQVTSYDPETTSSVHIVFDPGTPKGLYSYPNTITDTYLTNGRGHTHAWFTSFDAGYTVTIRRTDNNMPIELYGVFASSKGCIVVSHVEAEAGSSSEYLQNQLDFVVPSTKYKLTVVSPLEGTIFTFGDNVLFKVTITDDFGNPGIGASVTVNSPAGDPISLIETPGGSGIYMNTYTLLPTDPVGTWTISFVASIEGEFPKISVPVTIPADQTPPATNLTMGEPKYISNKPYVTPDTPFTLEATDTGSGVRSTAYRIANSSGHDSGWLTYTEPFKLTSLGDGNYTIAYNSTDNVGNVEPTHQISVTLFSWDYVFKDVSGGGTVLRVNTAYKLFQFICPDKDYGIREAASMQPCGTCITITYCDDELRLTASIDTGSDYCQATAWDLTTGRCYSILDKAGIEKSYSVVRGMDNRIYYRAWNGTGWEGWMVLPGATCDSPAAAMLGNTLHIVVRGMDGNTLWYGCLTDPADQCSFSGWTLLSGSTHSTPTLTSNGNLLCLVVRGLDDRVYYRGYSGGCWGCWSAVLGGTCDGPAAALLGNDLHIVVRGMDGNSLWHTNVSYGCGDTPVWTLTSGATTSRPVLVGSQGPDKLCLVVTGLDSKIYYRHYTAPRDSWTDWTALPTGATCDGPAATMFLGELHIIVRGMDGCTLWHGYMDVSAGSFIGWTSLSGATPSPPTLAG